MAITFVSVSTAVTPSAEQTSITVTKPANLVAGDIMLAYVQVAKDQAVTAPSGWTLIRQLTSSDPSNPFRSLVYYKVAGSSEPAGYTWSWATACAAMAAILAYRGVDAAAPIHTEAGLVDTVNDYSVTAPSITTTVNGCMIVYFFGGGPGGSNSWTLPSPITERFDITTRTPFVPDSEAAGGDFLQTSSGPTGEKTATLNDYPDYGVAFTIALKPLVVVPNLSVNIGGAWKAAQGIWVNVGGVWKPVTDVWVNIGGVWKKA